MARKSTTLELMLAEMPALEEEISTLRQRVDSARPEHIGSIVDETLCLYALVLKRSYYHVYMGCKDDSRIRKELLPYKEGIVGFVDGVNGLVHSISGRIKEELKILSDCVPDSDSLELRKNISAYCGIYQSLVAGSRPQDGDGLSFPEHKDIDRLASFTKDIIRIHASYDAVEKSYLDSAIDRDSVSLAEKRLWSLSRELGRRSSVPKCKIFAGAYDISAILAKVNSLSLEMRSLLDGKSQDVAAQAKRITENTARCNDIVSRLDSMPVSASLDYIKTLSSLSVPEDIPNPGNSRYLAGRLGSYQKSRSGCITRLDAVKEKANALLDEEFQEYKDIVSNGCCGVDASDKLKGFLGLKYRYFILFGNPTKWNSVESYLSRASSMQKKGRAQKVGCAPMQDAQQN